MFSYDPAASLCLGYVGSAGLRVCIKPIVSAKLDDRAVSCTCGVGKHVSKFQPNPDCFYLRGNDATAYCFPAFPQARLPPEIQAELGTLKKTNLEWKDLFNHLEAGDVGTADSPNAPPVGVGKLVFQTPKKFLASNDEEIPPVFIPSKLREIEIQSDLFADDNYWWMEDDDTSLVPMSLMHFLRNVRIFMLLYKQWLVEPHEITSNHLGAIEDDMNQLKQYCETVADNLGHPINIIDMDFPDVWCVLEYLGSLVSSLSNPSDLKDIQANITKMESVIKQFQPFISNIQDINLRLGMIEQNGKRLVTFWHH